MSAWETAVAALTTCLQAGVAEFVVCAGARNAALVEALARLEAGSRVRVWRHFEERSAGFFALGRTLESGAPCAVVTTSGTAVAELLPAVIEAFYQNRPLVVVSADRPALFRGSGAPQTIDQVGIFGSHAFAGGAADWDGRGPWHLNVEIGESFEPLDDGWPAASNAAVFEPTRDPLNVAKLARWLREDAYLGLVVCIGGLEPSEREEVFHFCRELGAPVDAEAASGLREALQGLAIHQADRVLKSRPPGKVLRLGDVPSGRFWRDLETLPDTDVWSVCRNGLPGLARACQTTRGAVDRVIRALGDVEPVDDALDLWVGASARAARTDELLEAYPDSEPGLIRTFSHYAALSDGVFLGNSLPIREWNLFAQWSRPLPEVRANRGANGIDGQLSTWLGWSADHPARWMLAGDLTALYDLAAPFVLDQLPGHGRVLAVINNQGGRIFERLPRLKTMSPRAAECLTNPHRADFSAVALLWGMEHRVIRTGDDFDAFVPGQANCLLEIRPDAAQTTRFWEDWDKAGW